MTISLPNKFYFAPANKACTTNPIKTIKYLKRKTETGICYSIVSHYFTKLLIDKLIFAMLPSMTNFVREKIG